MNDLPSWVLPLMSLVFGAGGPYAGWLLYSQQKKKQPIDASTAQVANAVALSNAAQGVVDMLQEQVDNLQTKTDKQDQEIQSLKNNAIHLTQIWELWYTDLSENWLIHRQQDKAPAKPTRKSQ